ncbi:MAG TPA: MnhB domain-containing protein [Solirubrobacteraceae bacterium]|nr:MnhB domain-containing protein [Solirubrobacteraceae bacterium]
MSAGEGGRGNPRRRRGDEGAAQRREGEISLVTRRRLFLASAVVLAGLMAWGLSGMPAFGDYRGIYGLLLNRVAVPQEHATNVITAVNFDYRGFDTLGEEFILFAAVLGLALILRERRDEEEGPPDDDARGRQVGSASVAVRLITVLMVGPTVLLAVYIIAHGAITPGGGFQGGVIAATALLFVYLGGEYLALRRVRPLPLVEIVKAAGAGSFVLIGAGGLIFGVAFLANFLPKGTPGDVFSAGTIQPLSVAVGLEITGGFVLILSEFLDQTLVLRRRRGARR